MSTLKSEALRYDKDTGCYLIPEKVLETHEAEIGALRAEVERLNTRVTDLEDEKRVWESGLLPREETIRLAGYAEGFALAHEPARCGHARANYKDPEYGTEQYPTKTQCEACAIEGRAEAAEAARDKAEAGCAAMRLKLSDLSFCLFCDLDFAGGEQHLDDCPLAQMTAGKELLEQVERLKRTLNQARSLNHGNCVRDECTLCKLIDTALND